MPKSRSNAVAANDPRGTDVAYIALGSNLGDRAEHLAGGCARIAALPDTRLLRASSISETLPIGPVGQPMYLNQMVAVETSLAPHDLLRHLHAIEDEHGRTRSVRWGPRTLDLDIVAFDHTQVHSPSLVVPHPELHHRDFWLQQLQELRGANGPWQSRRRPGR